jgi:hypothetical protein
MKAMTIEFLYPMSGVCNWGFQYITWILKTVAARIKAIDYNLQTVSYTARNSTSDVKYFISKIRVCKLVVTTCVGCPLKLAAAVN